MTAHTENTNAAKADMRSFKAHFQDGQEFWTSEDGSLLALAIDRGADWERRLRFNHPGVWEHETFDPRRATPRYAEREWAGRDFFDGGGQRRGKVWRIVDYETPFPVMYYELEIPR